MPLIHIKASRHTYEGIGNNTYLFGELGVKLTGGGSNTYGLITYKDSSKLCINDPVSSKFTCKSNNLNARFAPIGATWYYDYSRETFGRQDKGYYKITSIANEIKAGKNCTKLKCEAFYKTLQSFSLPSQSNETIHQDDGFEWVYEKNDTVYRYIKEDKFSILYIFNQMSPGKYNIYNPAYQGSCDSIDAISILKTDYVLLAGKAIKRVVLTKKNQAHWSFRSDTIFQFIGSKNFLFPNVGACGPISRLDFGTETRYGLRCYEDGYLGKINFSDTTCDYLPIISGLGSNEITKNTLFEFQNNIITILKPNQKTSLSIIDVNGKEILNEVLENKAILNISDLSTGIYFIRAYTSDTYYAQKIAIE